MYMRRTEAVTCPRCGAPIRYGVKSEPSGWKVHAECTDRTCRREFSCGRIGRGCVDHADEVHELAERLVEATL